MSPTKWFFLRWNTFLQNSQKGFVKDPTKGSWPEHVFLFCSLLLWMFFWLSKQRGNLSHSCRLEFVTQLWQPMAVTAPTGPSPDAGGNLCLARAPGYEGRALFATAGVQRWSPRECSRGKAPSFRIECSGNPGCSFPADHKSSWARQSWKQLTACSRPSPHTLPHDCSWQNQ